MFYPGLKSLHEVARDDEPPVAIQCSIELSRLEEGSAINYSYAGVLIITDNQNGSKLAYIIRIRGCRSVASTRFKDSLNKSLFYGHVFNFVLVGL